MAELTPVLVNREIADLLIHDLRAVGQVAFADRVADLVAQDLVLADPELEPTSIPAVVRNHRAVW